MALKIISLNSEGLKHLERNIPFYQQEQPDVLCIQELFAETVPKLEKELGMKGYFTPMTQVVSDNPHVIGRGVFGLGIFSRRSVEAHGETYYVGSRETIPDFFKDQNPNSLNRAILWVTVDGFTVATTHFTWSPAGQWTEEQQRDLEALLVRLRQLPECILCGDFNAPRGGRIFAQLAERFIDTIPLEVQTSIDPLLHKAGPLQLMVDGFFTTPGYTVTHIELRTGVSDHQAIVAVVEKAL